MSDPRGNLNPAGTLINIPIRVVWQRSYISRQACFFVSLSQSLSYSSYPYKTAAFLLKSWSIRYNTPYTIPWRTLLAGEIPRTTIVIVGALSKIHRFGERRAFGSIMRTRGSRSTENIGHWILLTILSWTVLGGVVCRNACWDCSRIQASDKVRLIIPINDWRSQ